MRIFADWRKRGPGYPLQFGVMALFLACATLLLVLVVLPRRYVLSSGFRESGVSFPVSNPPVPALPMVQRTAPGAPVAILASDDPTYVGAAEAFWSEVLPLLNRGRYEASLPLFLDYLSEFPDDEGVRREHAVTLLAAGRLAEAVEALRTYLALQDDPEYRLLLARTLRDLGRMDSASAEYARLWAGGLRGADLALEWARALAWTRDYSKAEEVLRRGLRDDPGNAALTVELARVLYYSGRLAEADRLLSGLDEAALRALDATALRDDVRDALSTPEVAPAPPPTLLERAAAARAEGAFTEARRLLTRALEVDPGDLSAWMAYANLLQYELSDFEGALVALTEVELRTAYDPGLQFRMAQLEVWLGRNGAASGRLQRLLDHLLQNGPAPLVRGDPGSPLVTVPDVRALQGDLLRWEGDRLAASEEYGEALGEDPASEPALSGLGALRTEVDRYLEASEAPRVGWSVYGLGDTDGFGRVDLAAEWIAVRGDWVWGIQAGNRWLEGIDAAAAPGSVSGMFGVFQGARWWRWGTVRTGLEVGLESVRAGGADASLAASLKARELGPFVLDAEYRHGLAYDLTSTLQSVLTQVVQDHLRASVSGMVGDGWSVWAEAQATRLTPRDLPGGGANATTRLQGALSLGRTVGSSLTLGVGSSVMGFSREAPTVAGRPLFWDPQLVVSVGPYAQLDRSLNERWDLTGRVAPGLAFIDERRYAGLERVPHLSAEAGIRRRGDRFWTALDLFFAQGRFDGYRTWGARLSASVRNLPLLGGGK